MTYVSDFFCFLFHNMVMEGSLYKALSRRTKPFSTKKKEALDPAGAYLPENPFLRRIVETSGYWKMRKETVRDERLPSGETQKTDQIREQPCAFEGGKLQRWLSETCCSSRCVLRTFALIVS